MSPLKTIVGTFCTLLSMSALACPESLKSYDTKYTSGVDLCTLSDRYQTALQALKEKGIATPERLGNLTAPRFINLPDWLEKRDQKPDSALRIYSPAPTTWLKWQVGADIVDLDAENNYKNQKLHPLTLNWFKSLHGSKMDGLLSTAGRFRSGGEVGMALMHSSALSEKQAAGIAQIEYKRLLNPSINLVDFKHTICFEDKSEEFRQQWRGFSYSDWPEVDSSVFFTAADGTHKECGYFTYAPIEEVAPQMEKWLSYVNETISTWGTATPGSDPVQVAAKAQRWFVSIHPFEDGNGRTSRFVMDWLLASIGLPHPILKDMNDDLYSTEEQWSLEIGAGLLRAVEAAEQCVQTPNTPGCVVISKSLSGAKK